MTDAQVLIAGRRWSFAYYVSGYVLECALKSCMLARMIHTGWVFQEKAKIDECLTHDFNRLIQLSGLKEELKVRLDSSPDFARNWGLALDWRVTHRYEEKAEAEARALFDAINDPSEGVLPWIKIYW